MPELEGAEEPTTPDRRKAEESGVLTQDLDQNAFDKIPAHHNATIGDFGKCAMHDVIVETLGEEKATEQAQSYVERRNTPVEERRPGAFSNYKAKEKTKHSEQSKADTSLTDTKIAVIAKESKPQDEIARTEEAIGIATEATPEAIQIESGLTETRRHVDELVAQAQTEQITNPPLQELTPAIQRQNELEWQAREIAQILGTAPEQPTQTPAPIPEKLLVESQPKPSPAEAMFMAEQAQIEATRAQDDTHVPRETLSETLPDAADIETFVTQATQESVDEAALATDELSLADLSLEEETDFIDFVLETPNTDNIEALADTTEMALATPEQTIDTAQFTAELMELFDSPKTESKLFDTLAETESPQAERSFMADPIEQNSQTETTDDLFAPYKQLLRELVLDNQPLEPELAKAISRLEQVLASEDTDQTKLPELTEQMVEDIVVILTTLGCKEPKVLLAAYAKQHCLQDFVVLLSQEIPDLTKLIDYQQHLLRALSQATARSDRRQTIARLLRDLLFIPTRQTA